MNPGPEYYEYPALTTELLNLDRQTVFHIYIIIRSTANVNFKLCTFCETPLNNDTAFTKIIPNSRSISCLICVII